MQIGYKKIRSNSSKIKQISTYLSSHSIHNKIIREIKRESFDPHSYEISLSTVYEKCFSI